MRPDFGHVEDVPSKVDCLRWVHDLDVNVPLRVVSSFNSLKHILNHVVWILACNFSGLLSGEIFDPLLRFNVNLDVFKGAVLLR